MTALMAFVLLIVVVALIFDYVNGWHDAANSIATVVSTRVLSPGLAVVWAAFFNFAAFLVFGTHVAKTIAGDLINIKIIAEQ
ncbi:MAG TPA: inorganic phosphate transporter, partial [Blastocatellia bacterium]|nr:inorganic phosphate transporter [Blastocatellia bacterium]